MLLRTTSFSRRRFLKRTAQVAAVALAPQVVPGRALGMGAVAPSERITLAGLGIGRRGTTVLRTFMSNPEVQVLAICDVLKSQREAAKRMADSHHGNTDCAMYADMREMLARPDIDTVLMATGDRWHALASILACKAGKDVFTEKPCSLTIAETEALADTFRQHGRIFQAGTQRRSIGNFTFATNLVAEGKLGKLHTVHAQTLNPRTRHHWLPEEPLPPKEEVDWDLWLGPCPWRPYNSQYVQRRWKGHFDFHGGGILEWGTHTVDLCQWAAQKDHIAPVEYVPEGSGVVCTYDDGLKLVMRTGGWMGLGICSVRYEGDEGWIETGDSGHFATKPESLRPAGTEFRPSPPPWPPSEHVRNFLDCVKSRKPANSNSDVAALSHIVCHAAYIAWQLGRPLRMDPATHYFIDDDEADRMRSRAMREPWHI